MTVPLAGRQGTHYGQRHSSQQHQRRGPGKPLTSSLELSELSKSSYAARAAAYSRLHNAATSPLAAAVKKHRPAQASAGRAGLPESATRSDWPDGAADRYGRRFRGLRAGLSHRRRCHHGRDRHFKRVAWRRLDHLPANDGPASGLVVYVAEDVQPTVSVGEKVTPTTQIASMFSGSEASRPAGPCRQRIGRIAAAGGRRHRRCRAVPDQGRRQLRRAAAGARRASRDKCRPGSRTACCRRTTRRAGPARLAATTRLSKRGRRSPACRKCDLPSHRTHVPVSATPSRGTQRGVAAVSALMSSSHAGLPQWNASAQPVETACWKAWPSLTTTVFRSRNAVARSRR